MGIQGKFVNSTSYHLCRIPYIHAHKINILIEESRRTNNNSLCVINLNIKSYALREFRKTNNAIHTPRKKNGRLHDAPTPPPTTLLLSPP